MFSRFSPTREEQRLCYHEVPMKGLGNSYRLVPRYGLDTDKARRRFILATRANGGVPVYPQPASKNEEPFDFERELGAPNPLPPSPANFGQPSYQGYSPMEAEIVPTDNQENYHSGPDEAIIRPSVVNSEVGKRAMDDLSCDIKVTGLETIVSLPDGREVHIHKRVTMKQAVELGIITGSPGSISYFRRLDGFPKPQAWQGRTAIYFAGELAAWEAGRKPRWEDLRGRTVEPEPIAELLSP